MLELNKETWKDEVMDSELPVVVDFWAPWCGPCKSFVPTFEEVSKEFEGKAKFAKLNTQEHPDPAIENSVRGIPCIIVFNKGEEVDRIVGAYPKAAFQTKVGEIISKI